MPSLIRISTAVEYDATDRRDPPLHRDRHVDLRARLVCQSCQLSRTLVAEHGTGSGAEYGGPQERLTVELTRESRAHAAEGPLPAPLRDPVSRHVLAYASLDELGGGQDAALTRGQVSQASRKSVKHDIRVPEATARRQRLRRACG